MLPLAAGIYSDIFFVGLLLPQALLLSGRRASLFTYIYLLKVGRRLF